MTWGIPSEEEKELWTKLQADIDRSNVKQKPGRGSPDYVSGFYVTDTTNQAMGNTGWASETLSIETVHGPELVPMKEGEMWLVVSRAHVRVTHIASGAFHDGVACGSGMVKFPHELGDAFHNSVGEAETDAKKRAIKDFGRVLGLALYDKDKSHISTEREREERKPPPPDCAHYGSDRGKPLQSMSNRQFKGYHDWLMNHCEKHDDTDPEHFKAVVAEYSRRKAEQERKKQDGES